MKVSYTLFKNYVDYKNQLLCGGLFYHKYILKDETAKLPDTDEQLLGQYFEYCVTGFVPKGKDFFSNIFSIPTYKKLHSQLQFVIEQANLCKELLEVTGIEVEAVNKRIESEEAVIVVDIIGNLNGNKIIIDLKFSGKLNSKWDESGWHEETLHLKEMLLLQSLHYQHVYDSIYDAIPRFQFWVFSSKQLGEYKIFEIDVSPARFVKHTTYVKKTFREINNLNDKSYTYYPTRENCLNCPIAYKCNKKSNQPKINHITFN